MKALIKGGICIALGWLGTNAYGQEWRAAALKDSTNIAVVSAVGTVGSAPTGNGVGLRPVSLSIPVPLSNADTVGEFWSARPTVAPGAVVRGQAADDKTPILPLQTGKDTQPLPLPRPMPKDGSEFKAPQPSLMPAPIRGSIIVGPTVSGSTVFHGTEISSSSPMDCGSDCCSSGFGFGPIFHPNNGCCPDRGRFWISAEVLLWWQRAETVPPLVTSSPAGVPLIANGNANAGVIGQPNTSVLYSSTPDELRTGFRVAMGTWFQHFPNLGIEVNYLSLGRENDTASFASNGSPQLFRPFFNVAPANGLAPQGFAEIVAVPGFATGSVNVQHFTQLWGIEGNLRYKWCCGPTYWIDLLAGYRHLNLNEGIDITENLTTTPLRGSTNFIVADSFHTRSQFNGAQIGIDSQWHFFQRLSLGTTLKVAIGRTHEIVDINGTTTTNGLVQPGGLLALQGTNIGRYTNDRFAVLPEAALKIGWDVTDRLQLFVGYDFLYLSEAVRPGNQIDLNVNPNFLPGGTGTGPRQPAVLFHSSSFWAQGVNLGLHYRF